MSPQATEKYTEQAIPIQNISITPLLRNQHNKVTQEQALEILQSLPSPADYEADKGRDQKISLMEALCAIIIKRLFLTNVVRLEQKSDYLMCTEFFSSAINTLPQE
jgi:hypothetical protein